jgi:uncharacterized membrane protein YbhN (UPF0104 family)
MQLLSKTGIIRIVLIFTVLFSIIFLIPAISPKIEIKPLLQSESRHFIIISALFVLFHFLLEPLRWYQYARDTSPEETPLNAGFPRVFSVLSTTALFSYTMPFKLGLPTRIYLMKLYLGMALNRILYFLAVDGVINLSIWGLFGAICFATLLPMSYVSDHFLIILAGACVIVLAAYLARNLLRKIVKPLLSDEYKVSVRTLVLSGSLVTFDVVGFGLRHIAIFLFLGFPVSYLDGFLIGILSVFAGIASTLPMGLGAYDATLIFLLARHGVPVELASLAPILNRTFNLLTSMVLGGVSSIFLMKSAPAIDSDEQLPTSVESIKE